MEFNQARITVADTALTPILDWIIIQWWPDRLRCHVIPNGARNLMTSVGYWLRKQERFLTELRSE
jgi:hypothetical protein